MTLEQLRQQIDELDNEMLEILNKRMEVVKHVGELKKTTQTVIYRPEREKQIIDRLAEMSQGLLTRPAIEAIYLEIFAVSRNLELPERIAYLGPEGSFTHQAAESRFGAMSDYLPLPSIRSVFESVDTGRARFGVVPIENNLEGIVKETIDLLNETDLKIVAEVVIPVHFTFATKSEKLSDIKRIYSKDIAFGQCEKFLNEYFNGKDEEFFVQVDSTSKAAKLASQDEQSAAVCSHIAAKLFDVPILFDNIQDSSQNRTRFFIIGKDFVNQKSEKDKTTIIAKLPDDGKPGTLVRFLQEFENRGINLVKIESRPVKEGETFNFWFLMEFDGYFLDENVQHIMKKHESDIKWLGSYVKMV
ncbi:MULTISPECIES: prephenate dehydratase [Bacteroidota]|jgi:chorismate mutase/prephenate dehydratase|uniref:Bifunctional chorismate mutase/prephenate dehydratase n=1 Tax=Flectobacillus roseus TaxID=502259 RepID=A0ABT6Y260_9BACT|nr:MULTISPECIES: prephenate dehydratase [Bacteroidota]NBA75196.1 prephenate dehydratase [Emticicia sp. ODNR4P]MDI9857639.1 prephenate dehydratase [Flectobacillus roseus]MDI9871113.1 prephenate dehydratase [Flectobacillus roseus]NBB29299.1 prephenate dehydratase [Cellulophaga sp. BC115SP]PAC31196.1 chorismate mutase [Flectobacillus sp. BAB-3569]